MAATSHAIAALNALPEASFRSTIHSCCSSTAFVDAVARERPFTDEAHLFRASASAWNGLPRSAWLEAFAAHPRIGGLERRAAQGKFALWSSREQAAVTDAAQDVRAELAELNESYFAKHAFVFLICATGKSAEEMRDQIKVRLCNDTDREVAVAAAEQVKITQLRLQKVLADLCGEREGTQR